MFSIGQISGLQAGPIQPEKNKIKKYFLAFLVPSKTCKLPVLYALMHPIPSETLGFELNAHNTLEGLPPLLPGGHSVSDYQQECQIRTRLTMEHFPHFKIAHFICVLAHRTQLPLCMLELFWHLQMARRIVFTCFWKYFWAL